MLRALVLLLLLAISPLAVAQQRFRAAVSGSQIFGCNFLPIINDVVQWIEPSRLDTDSDVEGIASPDGVRVLALINDVGSFRVVELAPDGTQTPFFVGLPGFGRSITVAANGRVFVQTGGGALVVISPAGVHEATHAFPEPSDADLAVGPDGCTIYHVNLTGVGRFNGCTGTPLPNFVNTPSSVSDVLPLADGTVLVSQGQVVRLYDASGAFIRTVANLASYGYSSEYTADELAIEGNVLWLTAMSFCETGDLLRVSFATGTELSRQPLAMHAASGIVIGNFANINGIPTASEWALLLLAVTLAAWGAVALRT